MAYLIPADKGTHFAAGAVLTLLVLWLCGPNWAGRALLLVAIGREFYGWWRRGWRMTSDDAGEALADMGITCVGGALILVAASIGG